MDSAATRQQIPLAYRIPLTPQASEMPQIPYRPLLVLIGALSIAGSVAARAQAPKPVPGVPYQYWDVLEADGGERKVYFRNDGAVPITITQVVVEICENTRQLCGTYPSNLTVAPGKTAVAFKIERFDRKLGWRFAYTFRTHLEGGPPPGMAPPAGAMVVTTSGRATPLQTVPIDSIVTVVPALTDGATCGNVSVPDLPPGHRALLMIFGTAAQPVARRVMVRLDGNGTAYDYSDSRRDPTDASAEARQTQITVDIVRQTVMVRNSGGGAAATFLRAAGPTLLAAPSLGAPGEMIARIVKECGAKQ